jgi:hypothetical protein
VTPVIEPLFEGSLKGVIGADRLIPARMGIFGQNSCLAPAMQLALPVFADSPPLPLEHTPQSEVQTATQLPGQ